MIGGLLVNMPALGPTVLAVGAVMCVVSAVWYVAKAGAFHKIEVTLGSSPPMVIGYKLHVGEYKDCGAHCEAVSKAAGKDVESHKDTGHIMIWFDDPAEVPKGKCRYVVGLVKGEDRVFNGLEDKLKAAGYDIVTLPGVKSGVARFPFICVVSVFIALRKKVYDKLGAFATTQGLAGDSVHAYMEVTFVNANYTNYYVPLKRSKEFLLGHPRTCEYAASLAKKA